jgi:3-deoxy-7-phosphoheptulonate synthase
MFQAMNEHHEKLTDARRDIDLLDQDLIRLLKQRIDAIERVGACKNDEDVHVFDPIREAAVVQAWSTASEESGLSPIFTKRILKEILDHSRRRQESRVESTATRTVRVGYQGTRASYSELAAEKMFSARDETCRAIGYETFEYVFDALDRGDIEYALVPAENSLVGGVHAVSDLLVSREVAVLDEEIWSIRHCLAVLPGTSIGSLREVRSHPVALGQCRKALRELRVQVVEDFDTAGAAEALKASGDASIGVICSREAADLHGLHVCSEDVTDHLPNETRFLLLGSQAEEMVRGVAVKTTITFAVDDRCGALADCLGVFANHAINLTRLESRPNPGSPWECLFLADIEASRQDQGVQEALREIRPFVNFVRVLGTYPSRRPIGAPTKPAAKVHARPIDRNATQRPATHVPAPNTRCVSVGEVPIGGKQFTLILGPCAVESEQQIDDAAALVKAHGAHLMRGGAFKPRSSPHSFQGLGFAGLEMLAKVGDKYGMPVVTEVLRSEDVARIAERADMLQVGARNMQNFALLKRLGRTRLPVLLKRGMSATLKELLQAAEYILDGGNQRVVLCERGIRTFETATRNTLDISAVPVLKNETDLPIIVDPSHAAGVRHLVVPLALAAAAAGADGLIIEAHPNPEEALCDKDQALTPVELRQLLDGLGPILTAQGRSL